MVVIFQSVERCTAISQRRVSSLDQHRRQRPFARNIQALESIVDQGMFTRKLLCLGESCCKSVVVLSSVIKRTMAWKEFHVIAGAGLRLFAAFRELFIWKNRKFQFWGSLILWESFATFVWLEWICNYRWNMFCGISGVDILLISVVLFELLISNEIMVS